MAGWAPSLGILPLLVHGGGGGGEEGTSLLFLVATVKVAARGGEGRVGRGGVGRGCLLLVALALYLLDLFQRCEVKTERKLGGGQGRNHRLTVVPRRAELGV